MVKLIMQQDLYYEYYKSRLGKIGPEPVNLTQHEGKQPNL